MMYQIGKRKCLQSIIILDFLEKIFNGVDICIGPPTVIFMSPPEELRPLSFTHVCTSHVGFPLNNLIS